MRSSDTLVIITLQSTLVEGRSVTAVLRSYREVPEATAQVRKYTRDTRHFRLGQYTKLLGSHGDVKFLGTRYCFPFGVRSDEPNVVAECAAISAAKAVAVRTIQLHKLLSGTPPLNPAFAAVGTGHDRIKRIAGLMADRLTKLELPLEGMRLVCNPVRADALLGRKCDNKATETVCGVQLVVENVTGAVDNTQKYAMLEDTAYLVYLDDRNVEPSQNCSTLQFRFNEEMCVEAKHDENGRGGRIVEDYVVMIERPELLYCLIWDV